MHFRDKPIFYFKNYIILHKLAEKVKQKIVSLIYLKEILNSETENIHKMNFLSSYFVFFYNEKVNEELQILKIVQLIKRRKYPFINKK